MFKNISKSMILCGILGTCLFGQDIVIDKDSEAGKIILKSDIEYKEYLNKSLDKKILEKEIYKHKCEIDNLKVALAKLIKKNELIQKQEILNISNKILKLEEDNVKLKESVSKDVKKECKKEKIVKEYNIKDIEKSYLKYDEIKNFKVNTDNLEFFEMPYLESLKKEIHLKKGDIIEADLYTLNGWVNVKDKGWVKGYYLFPKVMGKQNQTEFIEICK